MSQDQFTMSASQTLFFRAEYVLVIRDCGGRWAQKSGTWCAFIMGILDRRPVKAIVLWASVSIGRWFWSGGEGRGGIPI